MSTGSDFVLLLSGPIDELQDETWLTLSEAKTHMRVDQDHEDAEILDMIRGARAHIEAQYGVVMQPRIQDFVFDGLPASGLIFNRRPIRAIAGISYVDSGGANTVLPSSQYRILAWADRFELLPAWGAAWPWAAEGRGSVRVTAEIGYEDRTTMPANIRRAGKMLVAHWYAQREAVAARSMRQVDMAVDALMNPYKTFLY